MVFFYWNFPQSYFVYPVTLSPSQQVSSCCFEQQASKMGAYQTITGSGLPSKNAHGGDNLRLGPLSPCKRQAKNYHFAGVPRKKMGVKNDRVDTNSAVGTKKRKQI